MFQGKAKYQTWQGYINEGVSPADAETKYIALAEKLIAAHKQSSG
jgi:acyl-CoA-binding protein